MKRHLLSLWLSKVYKKSVDKYLKICYNIYRKRKEVKDMEKYVWYFDNGDDKNLRNTIEGIKKDFPCFVKVENIELNWIEVTVKARVEDMGAIETRLARFA